MTAGEALRLMARLSAAYPRQEVSADTLQIYAELLADLELDAAMRAVATLATTSKFFPTVAEIRETAAEQSLALPNADEAIREIRDYVAQPRSEDGPQWSCPEIGEALKAIGGLYAWRNSQRPEFLRTEFRRAYDAIRQRAIRGEQTRPALTGGQPLKLLKGG